MYANVYKKKKGKGSGDEYKGEEGTAKRMKTVTKLYHLDVPIPYKECKHYKLQICANFKNKKHEN